MSHVSTVITLTVSNSLHQMGISAITFSLVILELKLFEKLRNSKFQSNTVSHHYQGGRSELVIPSGTSSHQPRRNNNINGTIFTALDDHFDSKYLLR